MFLFKLFWRFFPIPNKLLLLEIEARLWEFLIYRSEKKFESAIKPSKNKLLFVVLLPARYLSYSPKAVNYKSRIWFNRQYVEILSCNVYLTTFRNSIYYWEWYCSPPMRNLMDYFSSKGVENKSYTVLFIPSAL